jgi:hypothetical protein
VRGVVGAPEAPGAGLPLEAIEAREPAPEPVLKAVDLVGVPNLVDFLTPLPILPGVLNGFLIAGPGVEKIWGRARRSGRGSLWGADIVGAFDGGLEGVEDIAGAISRSDRWGYWGGNASRDDADAMRCQDNGWRCSNLFVWIHCSTGMTRWLVEWAEGFLDLGFDVG